MKFLRSFSPSLALLCMALLAPGNGLAVRSSLQKKPLRPARFMKVRTTAYTHTESDHLVYGKKNALDTPLRLTRSYTSAASDWSRFPVGTTFRIQGINRTYVIDDYGSALVGTNTIDLYQPTKKAMNQWGVRTVEIEILKWGDYEKSREVLNERKGYSHIRKMLAGIDSRKGTPAFLRLRRPGKGSVDSPEKPKATPSGPHLNRDVAPMPFASATPVRSSVIGRRLIARPVDTRTASTKSINAPIGDRRPEAVTEEPALSGKVSDHFMRREQMAATRPRHFRPMNRTMSVALVQTMSPAGKLAQPGSSITPVKPDKHRTRKFRPITSGF